MIRQHTNATEKTIIAILVVCQVVSLLAVSSSSSSSSSVSVSSFQRPELYHGEEERYHTYTNRWNHDTNATINTDPDFTYFEGWYHKLVRTAILVGPGRGEEGIQQDPRHPQYRNLSLAIVPGIFYGSTTTTTTVVTSSSISDCDDTTNTSVCPSILPPPVSKTISSIIKNESHAFIFVTINGEEQHYYRFDLETEFTYARYEESNGEGSAEEKDDYYIQIGNNRFSNQGFQLDLMPRRRQKQRQEGRTADSLIVVDENDVVEDNDVVIEDATEDDDDATLSLSGTIRYQQVSPWPIQTKYNLGAMGPVGYSLFRPYLECYHDVLSLDHTLVGTLLMNGTHREDFYDTDTDSTTATTTADDHHVVVDKNNNGNHDSAKLENEGSCINNSDNSNAGDNNRDSGSSATPSSTTTSILSRGYVEKDRGRSFPSLWIWIQTNSFARNLGTSVFFSAARIPILLPLSSSTSSSVSWIQTLLQKATQFMHQGILLVLGGMQTRLRNEEILEFPGFTACVWFNNNTNRIGSSSSSSSSSSNKNNNDRVLIPFATWTGAYFEKLIIDDEQLVIEVNSGDIHKGIVRILWEYYYGSSSSVSSSSSSIIVLLGRYLRSWIGSWFVEYDTKHIYYRLELIVNRTNVPHVMLYAPTTTITTTTTENTTTTTTSSKMKPFVNEALNAKVHMRLYEYHYGSHTSNDVDNDKSNDVDVDVDVDDTRRRRLLIDDIGEHAGLEVHQNVQYLVDNLCGNPSANRFICL